MTLMCDPDGGVDGGAQWRDWANNMCEDCPAGTVDCDAMLAQAASYDPNTGLFTVQLPPSTTEIVSGSFDYQYQYLDADGGFQNDNTTAAVQVSQDALTVDLSGLPATTQRVPIGYLDLDDACGNKANTDPSWVGFEIDLSPVGDGGSPVTTCVDID